MIPSSVKSIESGMYSPFLRCDSLYVIYYGGSEEEWEEFFGKPSNVDVYYYSEGEPTGGGKYWHYDENFFACYVELKRT